MEIMIEVTKMNCDYVLKYLEKMEVPIVSKKNHDIIMCDLEKMIFFKGRCRKGEFHFRGGT